MENLEIVKQLTEVDQRSRSNTHRLDKVEERLADNEKLLSSIHGMVQRQDAMDGDIKEIKSDVKTLTLKPAKRWEAIIEKVLLTAAAAIVGAMLAHLGLG